MWLGATGERIKWGLAYSKLWDAEKKEFMESSDVDCLYANYLKTANNPEKYIVRIQMIKEFLICSTRSSDGIMAKFDFDDPNQCTMCYGFNPFKEEPVEGEELEGDEAPSKDEEDEEQDVSDDADDADAETPKGSQTKSCTDVKYEEKVLTAICKNMKGEDVNTSLK